MENRSTTLDPDTAKVPGRKNLISPLINSAAKRLFSDESGATLVEYLLMVLLIAIAALIGVGTFGNGVGNKMDNSANRIGTALN